MVAALADSPGLLVLVLGQDQTGPPSLVYQLAVLSRHYSLSLILLFSLALDSQRVRPEHRPLY